MLCERTAVDTELLFELTADLFEPGPAEATAHGRRRVAWVAAGAFAGPELRGTVVPGEAESCLVRPDGTAEFDARLALRTDDGQLVFMTFRGQQAAPAPARTSAYRGTVSFATSAERYAWLNGLVAVALVRREQDVVSYRAFAIH